MSLFYTLFSDITGFILFLAVLHFIPGGVDMFKKHVGEVPSLFSLAKRYVQFVFCAIGTVSFYQGMNILHTYGKLTQAKMIVDAASELNPGMSPAEKAARLDGELARINAEEPALTNMLGNLIRGFHHFCNNED